MKKKKAWATGGSIVSYCCTSVSVTPKATAILVDAIVPNAFPNGLDLRHNNLAVAWTHATFSQVKAAAKKYV